MEKETLSEKILEFERKGIKHSFIYTTFIKEKIQNAQKRLKKVLMSLLKN